MKRAGRLLLRLARMASLLLLAALGTIALMRFAPGYFSDVRELDGQYGNETRAALAIQENQQGSVFVLTRHLLHGWAHGDLGRSRQFDVPVTELMRSRAKVTGKLLLSGLVYGWLLAISLALLVSARRSSAGEALIAGPSAILLAIPIGALATTCVVADVGGPTLVLTVLIGARDFKVLYRLFRQTWKAPHILYARSLGLTFGRVVRVHFLPQLGMELSGVVVTSFVIALSAIVPVEVIFDVPGLGQLAWSAAMNRDLPVLLAVTIVVAAFIGIAGMIAPRSGAQELSSCA